MNEIQCNLCGSKQYRVVYRIEGNLPVDVISYKITQDKADCPDLRIVSCLHCGLKYVNPQTNLDTILRQYRKMEDEVYAAEENGRRIAARVILKKVSKYKRRGRMLDLGCATGFLLDEARKEGWEVYGVELSHWAVDFARRNLDLKLFQGTLEEARFPSGYFDVLIFSDIIEHLSDPLGVLTEARRILKPDGILYISTPDIDSLLSKMLRAKWWGLQYAHLYYFSKKTLSRLLEAAGFKIKGYAAHARVFSFAYWNRRLSGYNKSLARIFNFISQRLCLEDKLFKVSFKDQLEVFAQKKRSLNYLYEDEQKSQQIQGKKKTIVVLPAYNAAKTLELTVKAVPKDIVDDIILVDDASSDNTVELAKKLGLKVFVHPKNMGYGANQKTCYTQALEMGAEIIVMVHPDYQYDPLAIPAMLEPILNGSSDAVFGSRMMKGGALEGGMPLWKHNTNILLTAIENVILGTYLTEYHSGFRAYSSKYLRMVNFMANSDNFVFDNEIIVQGLVHCLRIEEVPIRTRYFEEASTIKFLPSVMYGLGILKTLLKYILHTKGIITFRQFK